MPTAFVLPVGAGIIGVMCAASQIRPVILGISQLIFFTQKLGISADRLH